MVKRKQFGSIRFGLLIEKDVVSDVEGPEQGKCVMLPAAESGKV